MNSIKDKVIMITGASSGFGKITAEKCVSLGAKVILGARRKDRLEELRDELGLQNDALFVLKSDEQLKVALISEADLFLMPSVIYKKSVEGFGIAYVEAAQYGVPSIGGKDGGASDAIIHEKTGLICDGNKLEDIYSSIENLFKDNKYLEYGKEAKNNSENFLWDKVIEKYKRIL